MHQEEPFTPDPKKHLGKHWRMNVNCNHQRCMSSQNSISDLLCQTWTTYGHRHMLLLVSSPCNSYICTQINRPHLLSQPLVKKRPASKASRSDRSLWPQVFSSTASGKQEECYPSQPLDSK
eukprot:5081523-Amphidinium_carterae.1